MSFRIKEKDVIKATATAESGKLLATIKDSGFTTIRSVEDALLRKIPFYSGKKILISIVNIDEETFKSKTIRVN